MKTYEEMIAWIAEQDQGNNSEWLVDDRYAAFEHAGPRDALSHEDIPPEYFVIAFAYGRTIGQVRRDMRKAFHIPENVNPVDPENPFG